MINRFNIRVYFILFSEDRSQILLSDEMIGGKAYTKFPGGGLEFGEGIADACKREALEELGQEIEIVRHLYTTDFFMPSAFRETDQVISVYYEARLTAPQRFRTSATKFDFIQVVNDEESFRWISLVDLTEEQVSFPGDKKMMLMLKINAGTGS
jgi:8-oxo-dGTP diphosphatase